MDWGVQDFSRKRHASDDLVEEQPLSKRFSKLNINYGRGFHPRYQQQLHVTQPPAIASTIQPQPSVIPPATYYQPPLQTTQSPQQQQPQPRNQPPAAEERMDVDNVIYISDLDSSSSSDNEDERDRVAFHPELAKKLAKIPYTLANDSSSSSPKSFPSPPSTSTDLVLYRVPTSITVPEQKDSVRRAIIEARERARQKQANASALVKVVDGVPMIPLGDEEVMEEDGTVNGWQPLKYEPYVSMPQVEQDDDAMDIE